MTYRQNTYHMIYNTYDIYTYIICHSKIPNDLIIKLIAVNKIKLLYLLFAFFINNLSLFKNSYKSILLLFRCILTL